MRILQLAPHPFFQERGTPIDVLQVLRVLVERPDTTVDLLVYHEGADVDLPNLTLYRTPDLPLTRGMRPGFSLKKMICNGFMFCQAWGLLRRGHYDLIHAGEEAVFLARFFQFWFHIPYVYDLDSSIAQQIVEKKTWLRPLAPLFNALEAWAIRGSLANLPVCNALAELCEAKGSRKTVTIHDISQLKHPGSRQQGWLKAQLGIPHQILLYIGNLETYQGIDLLLEAFRIACEKTDEVDVVVIGGAPEDIAFYEVKAEGLGIADKTHFLGSRPFDQLEAYLAEADILACPRIRGINTPMKIFPYLHSGRPVLATDLYTHNQRLSQNEAYLAPADPHGFAQGIVELAENEALRRQLGQNGLAFVEREHTYAAHHRRLNQAYDWIESQL
ncbi:MAG: glycosyltransferase family 4 protein [Candidatus Tectomicrobia bacterium]|nr:glycosyltransferase family 4 protein [Candidatus Tectomicrobia bacterium]